MARTDDGNVEPQGWALSPSNCDDVEEKRKRTQVVVKERFGLIREGSATLKRARTFMDEREEGYI